MNWLRASLLGLALAALAACAAPSEVPSAADRQAATLEHADVRADVSDPSADEANHGSTRDEDLPSAPSSKTGKPGAGNRASGVGEVDYSCTIDADCTVKNVGNCCGYYPACVNIDSPTFPDQVKAACAASGTSSVCGFPAIGGCQCVEGRCTATRAGGSFSPHDLD